MAGLGRGRFNSHDATQSPFSIVDLHKKINSIVRYGTIDKIDHNAAQARIKIGPLSSQWIDWHSRHAGEDSDWAPPSAGEQVTVLCPNGNLSQAVFIHGRYQDKFPAPSKNKDERKHNLKDGTSITHNVKDKTRVTQMPDDGAHAITVNKQQNVVDTNGTRLVNDKATVHVHPDGKVRMVNTDGASHIIQGPNSFINC